MKKILKATYDCQYYYIVSMFLVERNTKVISHYRADPFRHCVVFEVDADCAQEFIDSWDAVEVDESK